MTGNLDGALDQISNYLERDLDARKRLTSALVYPLIVMCMAVVTIVILTVFVLPRFEVFFKSLHAKLPLPTRMLLGFSSFLTARWEDIFGVAGGRSPSWRSYRSGRSVGGRSSTPSSCGPRCSDRWSAAPSSSGSAGSSAP